MLAAALFAFAPPAGSSPGRADIFRVARMKVAPAPSEVPASLQSHQVRIAGEDELQAVARLMLDVFAPESPAAPALLPFMTSLLEANQRTARAAAAGRLAAELSQRVAIGSTIFIAAEAGVPADGAEGGLPLLGTVDLSSQEMELPTHGLTGSLYMSTLAVDSAHRKRGLGRALLRAAEAEASAQGVEGIYLHVEAANAGALSLYRGAGYSAVQPTPLLTTFTRALHLTHADPILMFKRVPCDGAAR
ncbi:hypothetical protein EMIHUDRAFT_230722 [Emiliania huxleyi CCMP1516]|nr:hypothetical protein EMIHUDRAFT_230722 [Emiliania huxleyi CCMP1516]EOD32567.1 hypothetical protein EMIHUDRAFT_230722 [Emiliania huxleyi CCMP1516]|eukprot:XP_005784996.1 hypothetical protein EMIHUDRAFT_230722 [Emiliania huxleyi CCMP1516]